MGRARRALAIIAAIGLAHCDANEPIGVPSEPAALPVVEPEGGCDDPQLIADHLGTLVVRYDEDYRAMRCFARIDGDVYFEAASLESVSLPRLESVTGNFSFHNMIRMTQISTPKLTSVGKTLRFSGNTALGSLSLPELATVAEGVVLADNSLVDFSFPRLTFVGQNYEELHGIRIVGNPGLHDLEGFSALAELDGFIYLFETAIYNLDGLANLTQLGMNSGMWFEDNPYLDNIDGIAGVVANGPGVFFTNNTALRSIAGLSGMQATNGSIRITNSPLLESLAGLENLETMLGNLWLERTGVRNLDALGSLREIGSDVIDFNGFNLRINSALTSIEGLANLRSVGGDIIIQNNPGISNCAARDLDNQITDAAAFTIISGNGSKNDCDY